MTLLPNRPGAVRGPNGTTLDDLLQAITASNALLQQLLDRPAPEPINYFASLQAIAAAIAALGGQITALSNNIGSAADTDCAVSAIEILCGIATVLGVEFEPPVLEPVARCNEMFNGGYLVASEWSSAQFADHGAANVFFGDFGLAVSNPNATVAMESVEDELSTYPTVRVGDNIRTICFSATLDPRVAYFIVNRYFAVSSLYHDTEFIGLEEMTRLATTGIQYEVNPAWAYRFAAVLWDEMDVTPPVDTNLFYTEGALG